MILWRFIFNILFIPIVIGINDTLPKVESADNSKSNVTTKNLLQKEDNTKKSVTLAVEGGNIVVPQTNLSLFKEHDAIILPKLPSEDLEETPSKNKGKHVVGRTGAPVSLELKDISTEKPVAVHKSTILNKHTNTSSETTAKSKQSSTVLPTIKPHKPLVLKYQEGSSIMADRTSTVGISNGTPLTQANKLGSHPGMIMPVVITILVVPLFAVLGYMALKRGQEAWKNRHYKRMDFLLDGMYND